MSFVDLQNVAKETRERDMRLGKIPSAQVIPFVENHVALTGGVEPPTPRSSTAVEIPITETPATTPSKEAAAVRLDELQDELSDISHRLRELRAELALKEVVEGISPTAKAVMLTVARYYKAPLKEMTGQSRYREIVRPRHVAMYLAKELGGRSFPTIGRAFGKKDHTTPLLAWRRITALRKTDPELNREIQEIATIMGGKLHVG